MENRERIHKKFQTPTLQDEGGKEEKVDLISDLIKFVAELNDKRYEGDTILTTFKRVMSSTFIDRYEYDKAMDNAFTKHSFDPFQRTLDRINSTVDTLDVKMNKIEVLFDDLQKDVRNLQFEVTRKSEKTELKELKDHVAKLPRVEEIKTIRARLSKTASLEDFYDVKSRITVVNEKMDSFMTKEYLNKTFFNLKKDLDIKILQFISKKDVLEIIDRMTLKLKNHMKIMDAEVKKIPNLFHNIENLKGHLRNTVLSKDFMEEKLKIDEFVEETKTNCLLRPHLDSHKAEIHTFVQKCNDTLIGYQKDNEQAKKILRGFDEVLLEKASKFSINDLQSKLQQLANKEEMNDLKQYFNFKFEETRVIIDKLKDIVDENQNDVVGIIGKETESIQKDLKDKIKEYLLSKTISPEEVRTLLVNKADKNEIVEVKTLKADKAEIENGEEKYKLFSKQLQHLAVLVIELAKIANLDLDMNSPLLGNAKYLLKQSCKVFEWIKCYPHFSIKDQNFLDKGTYDPSETFAPIATNRTQKSIGNSPKGNDRLSTFRSGSEQRYEDRNLFGMVDHPVIKAKRQMVRRQKRKNSKEFLNLSQLKLNLGQTVCSKRSESVNSRKIPSINIKEPTKKFNLKKLSESAGESQQEILKSFSHLKRSLKNELGI
ncbi:unnamed protein product [Moneuplotes crassus]|uniref:Uncharacterized protein n=1 Tax=Euplotes crassus TaxID=5936 RepID=A0AAD1YBN8_EUPCR|nr:unnamed protein product [Moneuplotes crassus]